MLCNTIHASFSTNQCTLPHILLTQVKFPIWALFYPPSYTFKNNILDWVNLPTFLQPVHVFIITLITFLAIVTITKSHSLRATKGYKTIQRESLPLICCNPPICNHVFIFLVLWSKIWSHKDNTASQFTYSSVCYHWYLPVLFLW